MPPPPPKKPLTFWRALAYVSAAHMLFHLTKNFYNYKHLDADLALPPPSGDLASMMSPLPQQYFPFPGNLDDIQDEESCWQVTEANTKQKYVIQQEQFQGCGAFGSAYTACAGDSPDDCNFIGKRIEFSGYLARVNWSLSSLPGSFAREVYMAKKAGEIGIGPRVHAAYFCARRKQAIIIMDKIAVDADSCVISWDENIRGQLLEKVAIMHKNGILHQDLAERNVLIDKDNTPWIIDYGLALELGTPIPKVLQAYDIASLYYELELIFLQFSNRLNHNQPVGTSVSVIYRNRKLLNEAFQNGPVENPGFSADVWLQVTRLRYNYRAEESFWTWQEQPNLMKTTTFMYGDAVTYVRMVLACLSPAWRHYFQEKPLEILRDCFTYTLGRIGTKQARLVKEELRRYHD